MLERAAALAERADVAAGAELTVDIGNLAIGRDQLLQDEPAIVEAACHVLESRIGSSGACHGRNRSCNGPTNQELAFSSAVLTYPRRASSFSCMACPLRTTVPCMPSDPVGEPEAADIVDAFLEAVSGDPFRRRQDLLDGVAAITGSAPDLVDAVLPVPGSIEWVRQTSKSRIDQGGGYDLDDVVPAVDLDLIRDDLADSDSRFRRRAVDRLMMGAPNDSTARSLVLQALRDGDASVRLAAIPGAWRFDETVTDAIPVRLREMVATDPDDDVRIAATRRLGLDADRHPETVKMLIAVMNDDGVCAALRAAAVTAMARCGRGYARVPTMVRSRLSWSPDAVVRSAAMRTSCSLTTAAEADDFVAHVVAICSRHPELAAEHQPALADLADRVPEVVSALHARLGDADEHARRACAALWGAIATGSEDGRARALAHLAVDQVDDVREAAREAARAAIGRLKSADAPVAVEVSSLLSGAAHG